MSDGCREAGIVITNLGDFLIKNKSINSSLQRKNHPETILSSWATCGQINANDERVATVTSRRFLQKHCN